MSQVIFRNRSNKSVEEWSNRDFVIYFSNRLEKGYGNKLDIPPVAWQGLMARMKGFRVKSNLLNPVDYKDFVDKVFSLFFTKKDYVPAFGAICSIKVLNVVRKLKIIDKTQTYTNEDFKELQRVLYSDTSLFEVAREKINLYE